MKNNAIKLDLLRTNVAVKKRNTDMPFLMSGADMLQSNDEAVKAWYLAERGLILNQLPAATPTPTPPPSPSDDASTTPSSTEAAPTPPSTEAAPTPPSLRMPTTPTPEADPAECCVAHASRLVVFFFYAELFIRSPNCGRRSPDLWRFL